MKVNKLKLKKLVTMLFLVGLALLPQAGCSSNDDSQTKDTQLYTCGMHPQVILDEPGNCPICEMKLTPLKMETAPDVNSEEQHVHSESSMKKDKKIAYWRAPMDPTYISEKPGKSPMGMDLIPVYEGEAPGGGTSIKIDPAVVQNMGVRTAVVERAPFRRIIRTVGHIDYNEETVYLVNLKFDGWIEHLLVNKTGEVVKKGTPLFEVYSPQLVATQEEYLLALKNKEKLSDSSFEIVRSGAEDVLKASRQRLEYWDISEKQIEKLAQTGEVKRTLTIYSPANGIVAHKNVVQGAFVKAGSDLFRIADLSKVWVLAHVFEYELPWIKEGQNVEMELPYIPGHKFIGSVDFIYPYLDPKTRDVKIRLVFHNPDLKLKPQMYVNIKIESGSGEDVLVIPSEAIIRSGKRNVVFIAEGGGRFQPRDIIVGPEGENAMIQVIAGLEEGQKIVTSAQFLLDSESRLRDTIQKMLESRKMGSGK